MDDCITLLLHRDQTWHPNLKECGHFYLTDTLEGRLSIERMHRRLTEEYGEEDGGDIFHMWFANYRSVDIIDTGVYPCRTAAYVEKAKELAESCTSAEEFTAAMQEAFPDYTSENYLEMTAGYLFPAE